jgi:diguanylate cyclase (GGDEF)-like protein
LSAPLPLNSLPLSRAAFLAALEENLQPKPGQFIGSALFLLRIDRFGGLSRALGYKKADQVLEQVSQRLSQSLRSADVLGQYDLGTVAVWMPSAQQRVEVLQLAYRLGAALEIDINGHPVPLTFSVACALFPDHGDSVEGLLRSAHDALTQAKLAGGNQVMLGSLVQVEVADKANDWSLQNTLAKAIQTSSLSLHYQPVVDLKTRQWVAVEALLRPRVKELVGVSTDSIMGVAETLPILGELTRWGLVEACTAAARWHLQTGRWLPVSVNLPGQVLASSSLVYWVSQALEKSGLPGTHLTLELTERSLVDSDGLTGLRLSELRALGCVLAIDDFGVGQASLAQLIRLPITRVKFDRSLIAGLGADQKAEIMLKHLLTMVVELGLQAVAEGIETPEQAAILLRLGCQAGQGYYFSVPLSAQAVTESLMKTEVPV